MTKKTKKSPSHIHDKTARQIFSDLDFAKRWLLQRMPPDLVARIDWDHLKSLPTSIITQALGGTESIVDLLFETRLSGHLGLLYVLIEHKSYPDHFLSLQTHVYQAHAWWQYHLKNPQQQKLPLIYTIVLHHGRTAYHHATDFRDLIDAPPDLVEAYVLRPFHLIDLCCISDEAITGDVDLRAVELIMKHITDPHLLAYLKDSFTPLLQELLRVKKNKNLAEILLEYVVRAGNIESVEQFRNFIAEAVAPVSPEIGDTVVSLGDRLIQQGLEKGLERGLEKGRRQALRVMVQRMLERGATDDFILSVTELSRKELIAIKRAINAQNPD